MSIRSFFRRMRRAHSYQEPVSRTAKERAEERKMNRPLSERAEENADVMQSLLGNSPDVKAHTLRFGPDGRYRAILMYIDGLTDNKLVADSVVRPILSYPWPDEKKQGDALAEMIYSTVLFTSDMEKTDRMDVALSDCLSGQSILFVEGSPTALVISAKGWEKRGVTEPESEAVIRGPREGFIENLLTNTTLIRRRIKTPMLRIQFMSIGEKTKTNVAIAYIEGVADPKVLEKLRYRLENIKVDAILDSGTIEQYIEDHPFSIFATIGYTEKPDVAASRVLEGRIAIIVDGSPFVLTAPMQFLEPFQTGEDYYARTIYASITRALRYAAYLTAIYLPGIFVALSTFHQELIPTTLLFTIANARKGTPFPAVLEALLLIFAFEIIREAGLRLPRPVGQAISIVGAIVMGEAAVTAGLVGAPMVIIVAFSAVSSFVVPELYDTSTVLRIFVLILGSTFGGYGIALAFWLISIRISSLKSFGVPFYDGFAFSTDLKDSIIRVPLFMMNQRPKDIAKDDTKRSLFFIPPLRPDDEQEEDDE